MTISNKIAMDIATANIDTAATCPTWMLIVLGVLGLALVVSIIALFVANR